jgi:hypothetical protein
MPILRRRPTLRRGDLSPGLRYLLETGSTNYLIEWPQLSQVSRERFEELWAVFGGEITTDWIAKHPGTRPFGWWLLVHGKERPVVGEPIGRNEKFAHTFGFLHEEAGFNRRGMQESQADYLRRHGLLSETEIRALATQAREDESCQS